MKCWVCETEMNFIEITEVVMIDRKVRKYKCPKCGEVIYEPININSYN